MDGQLPFALLVGLIGVALLFDFLNGLHDAANSIATVVSTRVLSPPLAVAGLAANITLPAPISRRMPTISTTPG